MNTASLRVSTIGTGILFLCASTFSGCGGADDVLSGGCGGADSCSGVYMGNIHGIGGNAPEIRAEIDGESVRFYYFHVSCSKGPFDCGARFDEGFDPDPQMALDDSCRFGATVQFANNSGRLTFDGTLDTGSCTMSGSYDFKPTSCCSDSGKWSASR